MTSELMRVLLLSTIASSFAMLLVLVLRKPMRIFLGTRAAYALWTLVPLSALVFMLPAPVASLSMPVMPVAVTALATSILAAAPAAANPFDASLWLAGAWLLGAGIACLLFVRQQRRFVRGLGQLSAANDETLRAQTTAGCPALLGAWRPRVVVPVDFEQRYSSTERELVLAHERTHRARGDAQINALAAVLRCVFWFNPLIHFVASRFRFDQELACDAVVISRFPEARRSYADAMLKTQLAVLGLPVGCHWQSSHPLKERIVMLKRPLPGRVRAALGVGLVATLVVGGSYAAWAAQPPNEVKSVPAPATASADHAAGYRSISRIDYPQDLSLNGDCVGIVTYRIDAGGNILDLLSLTLHGRAPQPVCSSLIGKAAAGIMAKHWTFEPALAHGKPAPSDVVVPIVFTAGPEDTFDGSAIPPGALDPIRVSAEQAPKTSSIEVPGKEDTSYRKMYAPEYPPAAVKAHQQGRLVFKVFVDAHGMPQTIDLDRSEPAEVADVFTPPSVAAIRHWRFNPPIKNGKPQSGYVLVPIDFALVDEPS
jgi:bla regulator protein blaR1